MPVFAEANELNGTMEELMPISGIARGAAALGHAEIVRDEGRVARGTFLEAGLGAPYWPAMALVIVRQDRVWVPPTQLPGLRNAAARSGSPYLWVRDRYVMPRFAGPPGSFGTVFYIDVLSDRVPASNLKDKWILVGVTAQGLGNGFDTPATADEAWRGTQRDPRSDTCVCPCSYSQVSDTIPSNESFGQRR